MLSTLDFGWYLRFTGYVFSSFNYIPQVAVRITVLLVGNKNNRLFAVALFVVRDVSLSLYSQVEVQYSTYYEIDHL